MDVCRRHLVGRGQGCCAHPRVHRTLSPQRQNYLAPNLNSAEVEKPDLGVLTL